MMRDDRLWLLFVCVHAKEFTVCNAVEKSFQILVSQVGYFFQGQEEVGQVNMLKYLSNFPSQLTQNREHSGQKITKINELLSLGIAVKFHSFSEYVTIQSHELTNKSFWKTQPLFSR